MLATGAGSISATALASCSANAILVGVGSVSSLASLTAKGYRLGEEWSTSTAGTETWSTVSAGVETWTNVTAGTETWSDIAAGSNTWTDTSSSSNTWLQQG